MSCSNGLDERSGVLVVGHGTRDPVGTSQFLQLAKLVSQRLEPVPVEAAFLEFQQPTIPEAWDALASRGVRRVRVAPLLLFAAGHAKQDIPNLLEECQSKTSGISFDQARPLSRHPAMVQLACHRLSESLRRSRSPDDRTAVVMIGRGSYDPCAQADMRVLAEVVARQVGVGFMATAFYAMATPQVPQTLNELASSGRFDTIVVQPHLLFEGRLFQAIVEQMQEARRCHPSIDWIDSQYLGPDPLVVEAIAGRVQ